MQRIELKLDLGKSCIETHAKRTYENLLRKYFRETNIDQQKRELEKQIEGLKFFLEHVDFRHLRANYAQLGGQSPTVVTLSIAPKLHDIEINSSDGCIRPQLLNDDGVVKSPT